MSNALLRRFSRPGLIAAIALVGLGIPSAGTAAAAAQTETVDRTAAFTPGATLKVRNFSGRVTITGTDRRDVSVHAVRRASQDRLDRIKLDVREEGGGVVVEANKQLDPDRHNDNVVETDLTIEVPHQANLDVETFSSPVIVRDVTGTRHRVKTFSGDQQLERVAGPLDADAFSGSVALPAWAGGDPLKVSTFSGHIEVQVPPTANGSIEFDTFSGDFATDVALTMRAKEKRTIRAELPGGAGGAGTVRLHTFSGDVHLRK
jgi:DUF4097 and DUF4098 domain-containing protein YvlB